MSRTAHFGSGWMLRTRRSFGSKLFVLFVLAISLTSDIRYRTIQADEPVVTPWWTSAARQSFWSDSTTQSIPLEEVIVRTLSEEPGVQMELHTIAIARESIIEQDAAFDVKWILDSGLGRTNDPVGNSLVTGGPPRLVERSWDNSASIERLTRRGGQLSISQDAGFLDSNSNFFAPEDQANTRLAVSLVQPILGRGKRAYNERLLIRARLDSNQTEHEAQAAIANRLLAAMETYHQLHAARGRYIQQVALLDRSREVLRWLKSRLEFDVAPLEVSKVEARIRSRQRVLVNLKQQVFRLQIELVQAMGGNELVLGRNATELHPETPDIASAIRTNDQSPDVASAVEVALLHRPEIQVATAALQSAALEMRVTKTELTPYLAAVFNGYLSGLRGDQQYFGSFTDQFTRGGPGLSASIQYELPVGRRAARSRHRQAHLRYQLRNEELKQAILQTTSQVQTAMNDWNASMEAMSIRSKTLEFAEEEEQLHRDRWLLHGPDQNQAAITLETLLEAQQRRTDAENQWVMAETDLANAWLRLQLAMGVLLESHQIQDSPSNDGMILTDGVGRSTNEPLLFEQPPSVIVEEIPQPLRLEEAMIETIPLEMSDFAEPDQPRAIGEISR
ncbi:MAG: TolC family protein [Planctomycetota bacterium]